MNYSKHEKLLLKELNEDFSSAVLPVSILIGFESVLGFFGNTLVLYVFFFKYKKGNFRTYIMFLGAICLTSCLTAMPAEIVTQQNWYINQYIRLYIYLCKAKTFFITFTTLAETMCLLLISIDRYRKICKHSQWQVQRKAAHVCCLLIIITSAIVAAVCPSVWETRSFGVVYNGTMLTTTVCGSKNVNHHIVYFSTTGTIIMILLVVMFFMYILIAAKLRLEQRKHSFHSMINLSSSQHSVAAATTACGQEDQRVVECTDVSTGGNTENSSRFKSRMNLNSPSYNKILLVKYSETESPAKRNDASLPVDPRVQAQLTKQCVSEATSNIEISTTSEPESDATGETHIDVRPRITCESNREFIQKQYKSQSRLTTRAHRKTRMMMILTYLFITTTIIYFSIKSFVDNVPQFVHNLSDGEKVAFLFFLHSYFIQQVINPFVYGVVDKQFQTILKNMFVSTERKTHTR